ncbi:MAG: DUF2088 domain-containing protein [Planctomycetaceae bacterium]|nr:DUF2088 domain-containing protein [Planctomycetaceae bacterium]
MPQEEKFKDWWRVLHEHRGAVLVGAVAADTGSLLGESSESVSAAQSIDVSSAVDWSAKLAAALQAPLDAAPLADAVYPDDTVAISVGPDVPGSQALVEALVDQLTAHGVRPQDIRILNADGSRMRSGQAASTTDSSSSTSTDRPRQILHHADDQESLSMVGVSRHNHAIYLNRYLVEADVVIPIVLMNRDEALTLSGSIYPMWSSAETQERLRGHHVEQSEEAKEAESLVCPFLMIGVVPAPGGETGEVIAGVRGALQHYAKHRLKSLWTAAPASHKAVLATLEAHYDLGLWDRLRRALQNALALSAEQAPILLLLGPGVVGSGAGRGGTKKRNAEKARLIEVVEEATRHRPIFLASELDASEIEDLGLGAIESLAEFSKLIQRFPDLAVIRDADRWSILE